MANTGRGFISTQGGKKGVRVNMRMDPALTLQLIVAFKLSKRVVNAAADNALLAELPSIKAQSQREVPFRTGMLQGAWFEQPRSQGRKRQIDFGYSMAIAPYAWLQHEIPFNHTNGRKWKFLEDPVTQHSARMGNRMGASLSNYPGLIPRSRGRARI